MQSCETGRKKKTAVLSVRFSSLSVAEVSTSNADCVTMTTGDPEKPSALYMAAPNVLKAILRLSLLLLLLRLFLCQDLPSTPDSSASFVNCWDGHLHTDHLKASAPP